MSFYLAEADALLLNYRVTMLHALILPPWCNQKHMKPERAPHTQSTQSQNYCSIESTLRLVSILC